MLLSKPFPCRHGFVQILFFWVILRLVWQVYVGSDLIGVKSLTCVMIQGSQLDPCPPVFLSNNMFSTTLSVRFERSRPTYSTSLHVIMCYLKDYTCVYEHL